MYVVCESQGRLVVVTWLLEGGVAGIILLTCMKVTEKMCSRLNFSLVCVLICIYLCEYMCIYEIS